MAGSQKTLHIHLVRDIVIFLVMVAFLVLGCLQFTWEANTGPVATSTYAVAAINHYFITIFIIAVLQGATFDRWVIRRPHEALELSSRKQPIRVLVRNLYHSINAEGRSQLPSVFQPGMEHCVVSPHTFGKLMCAQEVISIMITAVKNIVHNSWVVPVM